MYFLLDKINIHLTTNLYILLARDKLDLEDNMGLNPLRTKETAF